MKTPAFWQSDNLASRLLIPAAWLYRFGAWMDRRYCMPEHAPIPVISVGNVTAGGAGKTPTTCALAPLLTSLGFTPHLLTRGYRSHGTLTAHRITASDDWQRVGDEAILLSRIAPSWAGRSRLISARAAAEAGATVALCDDALQHYRLHKDISLLVIDGPYGIGNGRLLPAGPLREPFAAALARSHAVILIGDDAQLLTAVLPIPVFRAKLEAAADTAFLTRGIWLAFAGIGRPEKFFASLQEYGATLAATRCFPDHHPYSDAECAALMAEAGRLGARLITTEKDAVKLPPAMQAQVSILPIRLVFEDRMSVVAFLRARLATHKPA
jgi:tetraacyldisaccharide 4'-kinase